MPNTLPTSRRQEDGCGQGSRRRAPHPPRSSSRTACRCRGRAAQAGGHAVCRGSDAERPAGAAAASSARDPVAVPLFVDRLSRIRCGAAIFDDRLSRSTVRRYSLDRLSRIRCGAALFVGSVVAILRCGAILGSVVAGSGCGAAIFDGSVVAGSSCCAVRFDGSVVTGSGCDAVRLDGSVATSEGWGVSSGAKRRRLVTEIPHDERLWVTILLALVSTRTNAARSAPTLLLTNLDGLDAAGKWHASAAFALRLRVGELGRGSPLRHLFSRSVVCCRFRSTPPQPKRLSEIF